MLCSFSKLREAVETIKQAVNNGNTLEKWNLIGRSIGKFFYSIRGARKKFIFSHKNFYLCIELLISKGIKSFKKLNAISFYSSLSQILT